MVGSGALKWLVLVNSYGNVTSVLVLGMHQPLPTHTAILRTDERTNSTQHMDGMENRKNSYE